MTKKILTLIMIGALVGGYYWHEHLLEQEKLSAELQIAQIMLEANQTEDAIAHLSEIGSREHYSLEQEAQWVELILRGYEEAGDASALEILYREFPNQFFKNETASVILSKYFLNQRRLEDFKALRSHFKGKEKHTNWFFLDGEALIVEGRNKDAIEHLKSQTFTGDRETSRLVSLALIHAPLPEKALTYLEEAAKKDQKNGDLCLFKSACYETLSNFNLAAHQYIEAVKGAFEDIYLRERLVDFLLNHSYYDSAIKVLEDSLAYTSADFMWLKALFWDRVAAPIKIKLNPKDIPQGKAAPFIRALIAISDDTFSDLTASSPAEHASPEIFWLTLLELLREGKEYDALNLLKESSFSVPWSQAMEEKLKFILEARIYPKKWAQANHSKSIKLEETTREFFLSFLNEKGNLGPQQSEVLHEILMRDNIFVLFFLSQGWDEAAIKYFKKLPAQTLPKWASLALFRAINTNRGIVAALEFTKNIRPFPELLLAKAQLAAENRDDTTALNSLSAIWERNDLVGEEAAIVKSWIHIKRGEYHKAKESLQAHPSLVKGQKGKEILARIAVSEGREQEAVALYTDIVEASPEAQSFLIRHAYQKGEVEKAKNLTESLFERYPDSEILKTNMNFLKKNAR